MNCYVKTNINVQVELNKSDDRQKNWLLCSQHKGQYSPDYTKLTTHHLTFISPVYGLVHVSFPLQYLTRRCI
jgi:hypothetical protein